MSCFFSRVPRGLIAAAALATTLTAALSVAGCGSSSLASPAGGTVKALEGRLWTATRIDGVAEVLPADRAVSTATFAAGAVAGSGGVNSYSASYTAKDGGTIRIGRPVSTLMAGPPRADAQERAFFAALAEARRFAVTGDTLELSAADGRLLIAFRDTPPAPLTGSTWSALAYDNGKGGLQSLAAGSEITAVFGEDGALSGLASVNTYSTSYSTGDDGAMTIDGRIAVTGMAGAEESMAQERAYLAALPRTATYSIEGDELWLRDAAGAAVAHYVVQ